MKKTTDQCNSRVASEIEIPPFNNTLHLQM